MSRERQLKICSYVVEQCVKCPLNQTRTQTVFGSGDPYSPIFIVGEAPGAMEDERGLPFQGQSGTMLDDILASIGIDRESVYISNVLKCRPPRNRNPETAEISSCWQYLESQVNIVKPQVLVGLGTFASQFLSQKQAKISELRKEQHISRLIDGNETPVIATYHPAYALRNPKAKDMIIKDLECLKSFQEPL